MKILVQNCLTHLYLKTLSDWTADPDEAMSFRTSESAIVYCTRHRIPAVQIALKFNYEKPDPRGSAAGECDAAASSQKALLN